MGELFQRERTYEKEHPKLNDAPSLVILDSFSFIFGVFAAISAFMNLVAPRRTGYGLITLILGSLTGGALLLYLMYYFFYQYMDGTKDRSERPLFEIHADSCRSHVPLGHRLVLYFITPQVLNPTIPDVFCHRFRSSSACPSYLKERFILKVRAQHPQLDVKKKRMKLNYTLKVKQKNLTFGVLLLN